MRGIASSPKSRRSDRIQAYVTPEEFALIMASSERAGLSMSEFARRELLKVNADLGRLGGLLKQTLASGHKEQIYGLLHKIDQAQAELKAKIKAL